MKRNSADLILKLLKQKPKKEISSPVKKYQATPTKLKLKLIAPSQTLENNSLKRSRQETRNSKGLVQKIKSFALLIPSSLRRLVNSLIKLTRI